MSHPNLIPLRLANPLNEPPLLRKIVEAGIVPSINHIHFFSYVGVDPRIDDLLRDYSTNIA